jgi:hypothetical protein
MADQPRAKSDSDNENRCRPKKSHISSVAKSKRATMDGLCCRCRISRGVFDMSDQRSRVRTASQKSNSRNRWQLHSFRQYVPSMRRKLLTNKPRSLNEKQLSREQQSALANAKAGIEQRVADAKAELIRRRREHDDSTMAAKGPRRALPRGRSLRIRPAAQAPTLSVADAKAIRAGCGGGQAWLRPAMDIMTLSTSSAATRRRGGKTIVRYEDLCSDPAGTVSGLLAITGREKPPPPSAPRRRLARRRRPRSSRPSGPSSCVTATGPGNGAQD